MRGPDPGRPDWLIESHSEPGSFDDSWPMQRLVGIGRGGTEGGRASSTATATAASRSRCESPLR
jgi:hypothetical protein